MSTERSSQATLRLSLTPQEIETIGAELLRRVTAPKADVSISCRSTSSASFARNEMLSVAGQKWINIHLRVDFNGRFAGVSSDRTDMESLALMVAEAEALARQLHAPNTDGMEIYPPRPFVDPPLYFDSSLKAGEPEVQAAVLHQSIEKVVRAGLVGAGDLVAEASSYSVMNTLGMKAHTRRTRASYSVAARSSKGSGWARSTSEDFAEIDVRSVNESAIDIARRSANPVAVEPGRYTVILEPDALGQLVDLIFGQPTKYLSRTAAEDGESVFSRFEGTALKGTKLGLQVADRRVQLISNPTDPLTPMSPLGPGGMLVSRADWITDGVLKQLAYMAAQGRKNKWSPEYLVNPQRGRLEITGPTQSLEDMIASTQRGIWIHRFAGLSVVSATTLLLSGVTRDGTFLIENGKVTKPIKNLRFLDSPFFILNKIDAAGKPVRAGNSACPRLKVRDFEFTSLSDTI